MMRAIQNTPGLATLLALAVSCAPLTAGTQQVFAYPSAGQSEAQQSQDRFECHRWSVAQSGFDPSTAPPLQAQPAPPPPPDPYAGYADQRSRSRKRGLLGIGDGGFFEGSGAVGDAAIGAALGAAGGAIAGNVGEGAAIRCPGVHGLRRTESLVEATRPAATDPFARIRVLPAAAAGPGRPRLFRSPRSRGWVQSRVRRVHDRARLRGQLVIDHMPGRCPVRRVRAGAGRQSPLSLVASDDALSAIIFESA